MADGRSRHKVTRFFVLRLNLSSYYPQISILHIMFIVTNQRRCFWCLAFLLVGARLNGFILRSKEKIFITSTGFASAFAPRPITSRQSTTRYFDEKNSDATSEEDWRDVRAKLIRQFQKQQQPAAVVAPVLAANNTASETKGEDIASSWAYDADGLIERGSLIVSHPVQDFACGGLRQQSFTKAVVLVVKDTASFTKGIILNRNSLRYALDEWDILYGGDVQGIDSEESDFTCFHRLSAPLAKELSYSIIKDIQHTTLDAAKLLVKKGVAKPSDFVVFAGYAGWAPNKLDEEIQRGNWFMAATDHRTVSDLLWPLYDSKQDKSTGIVQWHNLMERIGKTALVDQYSGKQMFEETMLKEWLKEREQDSKTMTSQSTNNGMIIQPQPEGNAGTIIQEGAIYRTKKPIVLNEQVFHQSLVLILKSDERGYIGVILNRPSSRIAEIGSSREIPIRYGGRYGLQPTPEQSGEQTSPSDQQSETWLHFGHKGLRNARVGVPIVPEKEENSVWQCSREDAETAVEMGLASASDFLVTWGLTLWEKTPPPQGLKLPLTATRLERAFETVDESALSDVWSALMRQTPLTSETLEENLSHGLQAYDLAHTAGFKDSERATQHSYLKTSTDGESGNNDLPAQALRRWMVMFLLK